MLEGMFKKTYTRIESARSPKDRSVEAPKGLWRKCKKCNSVIYVDDVKSNFYICPKCNGYFRVHAYRRIEMICDLESFEEWNSKMPISNPLEFPGYEEKINAAKEKSKLDEAIVTGRAKINGYDAAIGVCDARFMMSSMGHNVGEKITYMIERAIEEDLPVIIYACSGGARMQEGIISLMQMAKTSAALKKLKDSGQLFISVLTDPTTGGVTASFAMLGDIIVAEPNALIGFAGPRVIEQTIGTKLPEGFQKSEFLLEHGFVDMIVPRENQKNVLSEIIRLHKKDNSFKPQERALPEKKIVKKAKKYTAWDSVLISRNSERPTSLDYIRKIFPDFLELHGDRYFYDDGAIVGGIASLAGQPVTVIGQQKGRSLKENKLRNFGMSSPDGYRKVLRLMKEAEQFNRPIICFIDTPGAFCGIEAEERGQGEAIARNLFEMSALKVPILSIVIGEGGSGGALGLMVSDEVWMLEHSIYSILSPEGFASILYKDAKKCKVAAENMKITAENLLELGVIEKIIYEDKPASVKKIEDTSSKILYEILDWLERYINKDKMELVDSRYQRFRKF
jgi:acetyl-coA carboxylase, carboxyl transferase, beta subunit